MRNVLNPADTKGFIVFAQTVPSGQSVQLFEVLIDEVGGEDWLRFRFLAPDLGVENAAPSFEAAQADFQFLCGTVALPYMAEYDLKAEVVVISLLDRPVPFGETDQEATQLIEAFRVDTGTCQLEGFL